LEIGFCILYDRSGTKQKGRPTEADLDVRYLSGWMHQDDCFFIFIMQATTDITVNPVLV